MSSLDSQSANALLAGMQVEFPPVQPQGALRQHRDSTSSSRSSSARSSGPSDPAGSDKGRGRDVSDAGAGSDGRQGETISAGSDAHTPTGTSTSSLPIPMRGQRPPSTSIGSMSLASGADIDTSAVPPPPPASLAVSPPLAAAALAPRSSQAFSNATPSPIDIPQAGRSSGIASSLSFSPSSDDTSTVPSSSSPRLGSKPAFISMPSKPGNFGFTLKTHRDALADHVVLTPSRDDLPFSPVSSQTTGPKGKFVHV